MICGQSPIDPEKFRKYTAETAEIAVTKYHWYYLPSTVHKILFHGAEIIEHAVLPIGSLSEEAQECRHKNNRQYREHHTRKISRTATNEDVFHLLMVTSDPVISNLRPDFRKKILPLSDDACNLLSLS